MMGFFLKRGMKPFAEEMFAITIRRHIFSVLFILYGTGWVFADSSSVAVTEQSGNASIGTLGNWFTLGRVSGRVTHHNYVAPYVDIADEALSLIDFYRQTGGNVRYEIGATFAGIFVNTKRSTGIIAMLPNLDAVITPTPGSRITLDVITPNISFVFGDQNAYSGFEFPLQMKNRYSLEYLSNGGEIAVSSDQYENSFYLGPQINAGQIRVRAALDHTIGPQTWPDYKYLRINSFMSRGITDDLAVTGSIFWDRMVDFSLDGYGSETKFDHDNVNLKINGTVRTTNTTISGGYYWLHFNNTEYSENFRGFSSNNHRIFGSGTYLLGSHITSLSQVNGNFDGYFTPLLGNHQLMVQGYADYGIGKTSLPRSKWAQTCITRETIRFGATGMFSGGQEGTVTFAQGADPVFTMRFNFTLSNIALRTRGPEEVSKFEYEFGYWPREGEFRIDGDYRLPLDEDPLAWESQPVRELVANSPLTSFRSNDNESLRDDVPLFSRPASLLASPDATLDIRLGVGRMFVLANISNIKIQKAVRGFDSWQTSLSDTTTNIVFANQFGLNFGSPESSMASVNIALFGQTNEFVADKYKYDFLVSFEYRLGL